ncbi:MAG: AI-2E family transporter [Candidatus Avilachnospira sp.]|jgi:predicted PurR-regulated permease PerM
MITDSDIKKIKGLIVFTIITAIIGFNWRIVFEIIKDIISMLSPFILGGGIAFLLNIPMKHIEKHLGIKKKKTARALSLIITIILFILVLLLAILVVAPQLIESIVQLQYKIPGFIRSTEGFLNKYFSDRPWIMELADSININWEETYKTVSGLISSWASSLIFGSLSAVKGVAGALTNFGIGFIFSIYLLIGKEVLASQFKKLVKVYLPEKTGESLLEILGISERIFSGFFTGQCLEACILGMMFIVTLSVLKLPYALLIGVLIAFTALIPVFGAFVGLFVGTFLMLIQSPADAAIFVVAFFIIQQIEGNLIYPHVVGNSVGLPAIWVLLAVTLGGSMLGVVGMILFIPGFSVLYALIRENVHAKYSVLTPKTGDEDEKKENS